MQTIIHFKGLFVGPLSEMRSYRWTTAVGIILMGVGSILSAFAKSAVDLYLSVGLVIGNFCVLQLHKLVCTIPVYYYVLDILLCTRYSIMYQIYQYVLVMLVCARYTSMCKIFLCTIPIYYYVLGLLLCTRGAWIAKLSSHSTFEHRYDKPWAMSSSLGDIKLFFGLKHNIYALFMILLLCTRYTIMYQIYQYVLDMIVCARYTYLYQI